MEEKTMNKSIDVQVGIYNTEYRLINHRDDSISVVMPELCESRNGSNIKLCHRTVHVADDDKADILKFFQSGELVLDANNGGGYLTLDQALNGYLCPGVHVSV
jgi:hypothetical protein